VAPLELIDTAFPGRAAFDVAVSRALLREVAAGKRSETLRLYRPDDVVAFSTTDLRSPGFSRALTAARATGFDAALRLAGGAAAVFHRETIAFAWCTPETDERANIRARFARTADWWRARCAGSASTRAWARCRARTARATGASTRAARAS
jgi:lipoate-protein ligase A